MADGKDREETSTVGVSKEENPQTAQGQSKRSSPRQSRSPPSRQPKSPAPRQAKSPAPRKPEAPSAPSQAHGPIQSVPQSCLEGEDENFMTVSAKEKAVWIKKIKARHAALVKKEQEHKKWKDGMMQRRVNVYNRSKKLLSSQRDRFRFLFKMAEVVKQLSQNGLDDKDKGGNQYSNTTDDNKNGGRGSNPEANENLPGQESVPTILVNEPTQ